MGNAPHASLTLSIDHNRAKAKEDSLTASRMLPGEDEVDMEVEMDVLKQLMADD